jgi:hypothetical protein
VTHVLRECFDRRKGPRFARLFAQPIPIDLIPLEEEQHTSEHGTHGTLLRSESTS